MPTSAVPSCAMEALADHATAAAWLHHCGFAVLHQAFDVADVTAFREALQRLSRRQPALVAEVTDTALRERLRY